MPNNDESFLSHINLKIGGSQASPEALQALRECVVENTVHLPDMCTLRIHDEQFHWLDSDLFKVGNSIEVFAGEEHTSQLPRIFNGEITGIELDLAAHGIPTLLVRCMDRSHRLHRGKFVKTFVQMKDSDIVRQVANEAGLAIGTVEMTSGVHEWVMQENQTNWEFLTSRAHYNGFRLYLADDGKLNFKRVIPEGDSKLSLEWGKDLRSFRPRISASPQVNEVVVRGWDPHKKQTIIGKHERPSNIPKVGESTPGGEVAQRAFVRKATMLVVDRPIKTQKEAEDLARSICDDIGGEYLEADGLSYGQPRLKPGMMVTVRNIGRRFSGDYFVTTTTHTYTPAEGFATQFSVSGKSPSSLLSMINEPSNNQGNRGNDNIAVGIVTDNKDPLNLGRIKVKYPHLSDEHASDWIRICSPMAGADRGFYFLPEIDDEVLVAFEHGDIHHAYMLGALWNGKDKPVEPNSKAVDGSTVSRRTIKTRIGHTLLLDDKDGLGEMSLTTKGKHVVVLNDKEKHVWAKTNGGHELFLDDQGNQIVVKDKSGNKITISTASGNMDMVCNGNFSVNAKGKVSVQGQMGIELTTPAQFKVSGTAGVSMQTTAQMSLNATAAMSVQSSAILTIQGTLVKIN